jgi:membrane fusion protein, multidrug efflux system
MAHGNRWRLLVSNPHLIRGGSLRKPILVTTALSLALLLGACGQDNGEQKAAKPMPEVGYVILKPESVPLRVELPGRTAAFETSEVRPQVSGIIQARLFTEGATVHAGDLLYRIDPRIYESAAGQARADLASAIATRNAARARAARFAELAKSQVVSQQDLLDAQAAADAASASAMRAAAALETAEINRKFTQVRAPIAGRIGRSVVTTGALVSAAQAEPLTTIQRLDPIFVDIQQSSGVLLGLRRQLVEGGVTKASTAVSLILEDGSRYSHAGVLQFAESMVDASTGTVTIRARFPNPDALLLPGMYVRAEFSPVEAHDAILAPQQAISRDVKGQATALVVSPDSKVELRALVADRTVGDQWLISSGLAPGDKLIVEGRSRVKPGQSVKPVAVKLAQSGGSGGAAPFVAD